MVFQDTLILIDITHIFLCFGLLFIASLYDFKNRNIPDWISLGLIVLGGGIILVSGEWLLFSGFFITLIVVSIFGVLLFKIRFWGGGDVKLLIGASACVIRFPMILSIPLQTLYPISPIPIPGSFILNLFIVQIFYVSIGSLLYVIANSDSIVDLTSYFRLDRSRVIALIGITSGIGLITWYISQNELISLVSIFLVLIMGLNGVLPESRKKWHWKTISVTDLVYGDSLHESISVNEQVLHSHPYRLTNEDISLIQKTCKDNNFPEHIIIWQGIPLAPIFMLAIVATFLWGDLFYLLLSSFI